MIEPGPEDDEARRLAWIDRLFDRYGVLAREVVALDPWAPPWADLLPLLARLELRGEIRRGYFVEGLSGVQYATDDAAGRLSALASDPNLDRDEVFVPGDERAQSRVDLHVSHGRLTVTLPGSWKFWSGGKALVEVHMRSIGHITVSGAADVLAPGPVSGPRLGVELSGAGLVRLDDLRVGELAFDISGAGEGQLAGQVDRLRLGVSGKGRVTADQLRARSADVSISGVGNAELWVTEALSVDISGTGRVGYWGHPRVQQDIDGFGAVEPRGERH